MISNENKRLAQWAMEYAQKNGCQGVRVSIGTGSNTSFALRDGKMDQLQQASENGMTLTFFVDGKFGTFSTNRLDQRELETSIKNSIESTRYLAVDEARTLPDPSRFFRGGKPNLQLLDPNFGVVSPDDKVRMAEAVAAEILGTNDRIISVNSRYGDRDGFSYQITSNGFEGETAGSSFSLSCSVSVRGEGDARPSNGWGESSLFLNNLVTKNIGKKALERTLRQIGAQQVPSGQYTMVMDNLNSSRMLNPLISVMSGAALQQRNSFLLDRKGDKIGSDLFTLIDNPHIIGASGARYFDGEGVATEKRSVFENGVLKTYYIDTYNANRMGVAPTISGPSILELQPGTKDVNGLIADINNGILVTGFNGGNFNQATGNFSYGIEGFLIENGQVTKPVSEMNITGNFITLWENLVAVGNDARPESSWRIPTLAFDGVDFSGS
ncbi:MAG: TldD/PmbA family protein [Dysgonamonadaceae bacterium]|jgi:PmbA protein|nr:TldD/PmbA family protein [Dysgonamonadaceae bacterium]